MADLPIFSAAEPSSIPAKVYDRIWLQELVIKAPHPDGDAVGQVHFRKYGVFESGSEFAPGDGEWLSVNNLLSASNEDPDLQVALGALLAYVQKIGVENNIINNDQ